MLKIKVHERVDETNLSGFKQMFQKFMGGADNGAYTNGNWKIATGAYDLWFEIYLNGTPVIGCVDGKCKWYKNPMEVGLSKADAPKIETIITSEYPEISFVGKNESICESFNPKTVKIGNQTWMAENLAIDDGGDGIKVRNGNTYYDWDAAMRVASNIKGWHLPTIYEFEDLVKFVGPKSANKLKSTEGWIFEEWRGLDTKGTDDFGFTALPVGGMDVAGLGGVGYYTKFWSSTCRRKEVAQTMSLENDLSRVGFPHNEKELLYSVRLIKD